MAINEPRKFPFRYRNRDTENRSTLYAVLAAVALRRGGLHRLVGFRQHTGQFGPVSRGGTSDKSQSIVRQTGRLVRPPFHLIVTAWS